jgi:hypothetical protein
MSLFDIDNDFTYIHKNDSLKSENSLSDNEKNYFDTVSLLFDTIYDYRINETKHYATFFIGKNIIRKENIIGMNYMICNDRSVHAEIDFMKKLNKQYTFSPRIKINLLVVRLSKTGIIGESRPCYHCLCKLQKYSHIIKYIYYSTSDGKINRELLTQNMLNSHKTHISSGNKRKRK